MIKYAMMVIESPKTQIEIYIEPILIRNTILQIQEDDRKKEMKFCNSLNI